MNKLPAVLAICGSTREKSANKDLINIIRRNFADLLNLKSYEGIDQLPHFNPDKDTEPAPQEVVRFRKAVKDSDGILICTPEYAMGVPGVLKNAIDWTVSSAEFSKKPVALITASSMGQKAHASLLETLRIIECDIPESSQLIISYVKTKLNADAITDDNTSVEVASVMKSLIACVTSYRSEFPAK